MKTVTKYVSDDGKEFGTEEKCIEHEHLIGKLEIAFQKWPHGYNTSGFYNGEGYLNLGEALFDDVWDNFFTLLIEHYLPDTTSFKDAIIQTHENKNVHSILGRFLDDTDSPFKPYWFNFSCVDKSFRLWGQPFFANNPQKGKQICLN